MRCRRDAGTLGERELLAASLALASIDNVLLLGEDGLNDVAMRAGMGWHSSLSSKRWRWYVKAHKNLLYLSYNGLSKLQRTNRFH